MALTEKSPTGRLRKGRWAGPPPQHFGLGGYLQQSKSARDKEACVTRGGMYCSHTEDCDAFGGSNQYPGPPPKEMLMALTERDRNDRVDQIMDAVDHLFTARLAVENIAQEGPLAMVMTAAEADAELEAAKAELRRVLLYAVR